MSFNWKKTIGLAGAVVFLAAGAAKLYYNSEMERYTKTGALILEYHSISNRDWDPSLVVAPKVFEGHLKYLQEQGYKMVTVEELSDRLRTGKSVAKYIALSFDDGYKDNYTIALPLLQKYNAKGTFAIINNRIGGNIYMNEADIVAMQAAGMEIASHTASHNPLGEIDPKYLDWEIGSSKYLLELRFPGLEIKTMAYPNGSYNDQIIAKLKQHGYAQALTGHTGMNGHAFYKEQPMKLNRVIVMDDGKGPFYFGGLLKRGYRRSYFLEKGIDLGE